jgi:Zn-dependent alcohol dehydrogenase
MRDYHRLGRGDQTPRHRYVPPTPHTCSSKLESLVEGSNVAVFGCGCIGLGCINAARAQKAARIIAIDTNPNKASWAKKFGGDTVEFVNPKDLPEGKRIQDLLIEMTDGGLDFTFDATGNVSFGFGQRRGCC